MTPSEASDLLTRCMAFDNRQPSAVASKAWAKALHDVPLDDDAFSAVDRYYGSSVAKSGERLWIMPADVRAGRLALRRERLGDTLPAYPLPAGDETGRQFVLRRRAHLEAVASGKVPGEPIGQLEGGPAPKVIRRMRELGWAGRPVDPLDEDTVAAEGGEVPDADAVRRAGPLGIDCPKCLVPIGRPCRRGVLGKERRRLHLERINAQRAALGLPPQEPADSDEEIERRKAASAAALAALQMGAGIEPQDGFQRPGSPS